jgi:hypothetical protein
VNLGSVIPYALIIPLFVVAMDLAQPQTPVHVALRISIQASFARILYAMENLLHKWMFALDMAAVLLQIHVVVKMGGLVLSVETLFVADL